MRSFRQSPVGNGMLIGSLFCLHVAVSMSPPGGGATGKEARWAAVVSRGLTVSSPVLAFGNINLGNSANKTVTLFNSSAPAEIVTVTGLTFSGPSADHFFLVSQPTLPFDIPASGNQIITVQFMPYFTGAKTATLTITSNDETTPNDNVDLSGTGSDPLPVQLYSMTAEYFGSHVLLIWYTATEINNYGFEVQKADTAQKEYQTILKSIIPGHGTTNSPQHYSYIDSTLSAGDWYYRLRQIDLDGTVHYSDGIRVSVLTGVSEKEMPSIYSVAQNYPNPFNPSTTIRYGLPNRSDVRLSVFNTLGQQVGLLENGEQEAGYHEVNFDASGLSSGVYLYRMQAGSYVETRKLLLVR
jgi:hypothetical protein